MRKTLFLFLVLLLAAAAPVAAQKTPLYRNAVGGRLEFGYGSWVGVSWKHLYTRHHASEVAVLFGYLTQVLAAEYHFNGDFRKDPNFQWVLGLGGAYARYKRNFGPDDFYLRPIAGVEARFKGTAINMGIEWRPMFQLTNGGSNTLTRFSIPIRIAF
ncbi:hypothetical protein [Flaviaesturariibacter amylovorans]|uniref:Outer membrane protein beta-barrel domain-containing protein n=1 Tax=Flaviaesturariibacter amylovorans TaxID=1084520 RepID=A0ABP8GEX1_9BACT